MEDKKYCFIRFKYLYNNQENEDIRVVGNTEALGNWNILKAIKLYLVPKQIGVWKTKEKIKIPLFQHIEYKYLIFRNNNLLRWEHISNNMNRSITIIENNVFVLIDKPDSLVTKLKKEITYKKEGDKNLKKKKLRKKME